MRIKGVLAVLCVMCLLFSACSAGSSAPASGSGWVAGESNELVSPDKGNTTQAAALPANQKLIRRVWLDAETEDMDSLLQQVENRIAQLGGYVEARQIKNGSAYSGVRYRYADLTIRIPAEKLDSFVSAVAEVSNITDTRETTEDVTLSYVEYESRVLALETEQARILELYEQAKTIDELLQLEKRLTGIREELELIKSQLRLYDSLISYSTVYLNISEVKEYTPVNEPENIWQRMGAGLSSSWKSLVRGLEDLLVFVVAALPYLVLWGGIIAVAVVLVRRTVRKRGRKKTPAAEPEQKE